MKKLVLLCAAIFTMAQLNAATPEVAAAEAPTSTVAADEDNGVAYEHPFKNDDRLLLWYGCEAQLGSHQQQL